MAFNDEKSNLRIEIDTHGCKVSDETRQRMRDALGTLGKQVATFPVSDVRIVIEHNSHDQQFVVKTSVILPNNTLTATEHGTDILSTFERCLPPLRDDIDEYKQRLDREPERHKHLVGTLHEVEPSHDPDAEELEKAVEEGSYAKFREATFVYEEAIRKRAGRWVERFPDVEAKIDNGIKMDDIVAGVFLRAFEGYPNRTTEMRFGEWLAGFIDPTVKAMRDHPDGELENIRMAESARDAES